MKLVVLSCTAFVASLTVIHFVPRLHLEATGIEGLYLRQSTVDFGVVDPASGASAKFEFFNHGVSALKIESVETDCACTVAKPIASIIHPGTRHVLDLTLSPTPQFRNRNRHPAQFQHRCVVRFSRARHETLSSGTSPVVLRAFGSFKPVVAVAAIPSKIYVGVIRPGQKVEREVQFEGDGTILSSIPREISINSGSTIRFVVPPSTEGTVSTTRVHIVLSGAPTGDHSFESHVMLVSPEGETLLDIPVHGLLSLSKQHRSPGNEQPQLHVLGAP